MEVVHKKTQDHICNTCGVQFDFKEGKSVYFGKLEYKTDVERLEIEKYFCSEGCADVHKLKNNER